MISAMPSIRSVPRFSDLSLGLRILTVVIIFVAGCSVGWLVDGNWTAEWVSAAGTWLGALGTIGAIMFAAHTFNHQQDNAQLAAQKEKDREDLLASQVEVSCTPAGNTATTVSELDFTVKNVSAVGVVLESYTVDGVQLEPDSELPVQIGAGSPWNKRRSVKMEMSADDIRARTLGGRECTFRYSINGIEWSRVDGQPPVRT